MKRFALVVAALWAFEAVASSDIDLVEHIFGVSNTNAVAGHGALTAGFSADGDLTLLSWPGPSFADQLCLFGSNAIDARALPHFGVHDGMGSYLGLIVETASGRTLTFFRDGKAWTHAQTYTKPDAPVPLTTFTHATLGLTAVVTDVVSPDGEALTRHLVLTRAAGSPVTAASLVVYENLSPTLSKIPQVPIADFALEARNDFFAAWDSQSGALLHFHPGDRAVLAALSDVLADPLATDYGPVETLLRAAAPTPAEVDAFVARLDTDYKPGVAALVATEPAATQWQVGTDATPICPNASALADNLDALPTAFPGAEVPAGAGALVRCEDPVPKLYARHGWLWRPQDALADLLDATLSGSRLAAGQTNGALVAPMTFTGDVADASAVFAFGPTRAAARAALDAERARPFAARLATAEATAHEALGALTLPAAQLGPRVVAVAQRALVNTYVATDRRTGAIVASITRQPPYALDWPRDGAFISAALDLAGRGDWVTRRQRWYAGLIRAEPTVGDPLFTPNVPRDPDSGKDEFPAGAWEMNYFADGTIGGPWRWEIDNTALHVWSLVSHAAALPAKDRSAFIAAVWPSAKAALELLTRWKDKSSGLPARANEDDHSALTSTLHGATTVYAALIAGARLAGPAGDAEAGKRYAARAGELRAAIIEKYFDTATGLFRGARGQPGGAQGGSTAWLAWPARVLDASDPRLEAQLSADMDAVLKVVRGENAGGSYVAKNVVSAALLGSETGSRAKAREAVLRLAELATADTLHFGEVYLTVAGVDGGKPGFSNRVATPHVWEGVLFYLAAMALTAPERFDPERTVFPLTEPPKPTPRPACSCGASEGLMVVAALMLGLGRRRRA